MAEQKPVTNAVSPSVAGRLDAIDFFRGLALTIVLLDHCDWPAQQHVFRRWTPNGLGFSDGADAFVFLSGLTFGWVYTPRLLQDGLQRSEFKSLKRVAQIYLAYALCTMFVIALSCVPFERRDFVLHPLHDSSDRSLSETLVSALTLQNPPFGLDILGLYLVILPWMAPLLALAQRNWRAALSLSLLVYALAQPPIYLGISRDPGAASWLFYPPAWQFLFVIGLLVGMRLRHGPLAVPRTRMLTALAVAIVLEGLFVKKRDDVLIATGWAVPQATDWLDLQGNWLISKRILGPLRVAHFAGVVYLIAAWLPIEQIVNSRWARPLISAGRHSLTLYCCGVLLVFASSFAYDRIGDSVGAVLIVGFDVCLLQFALAWWLERRAAGAQAK